MRKRLISIIGDSKVDRNDNEYAIAFKMGKALIDNGYRLASGGMDGVMGAAFDGAKSSEFYTDGDTVAILPMFDRQTETGADIVIATGLDLYRNVIVANSDAVIMIGGGSGTLCECANAWTLKRLIIAFSNVDGWSTKLADTRIDNRIRYAEIPEDRVYGVTTPDEAIAILEKYCDQYDQTFPGIQKMRQLLKETD